MNSISRRIKHDIIRPLLNLIQHLKHIPGKELTIVEPVKTCIFFRCLNRLLNNLHTYDLFTDRCQHLRNRTGSAVQIVDNLVVKQILLISENELARGRI